METQKLYLLGAILVGLFMLHSYINSSDIFPDVLPAAGYCKELNITTSYTTVSVNETENIPVEYCNLRRFCDLYGSVISESSTFEEASLNYIEQSNPTLYCFRDIAQHTQRGTTINGNVHAKFICCNSALNARSGITTNGTCGENICNGIFTGELESGCRVYGTKQGGVWMNTCGGVS